MAMIRYNSLRPISVSGIIPSINASIKSQRVNSSKKLMMCANDHVSVNLQIRSFHKIKVIFEDRSNGIVSYKDENGEIICEGYDEGPRFHPNKIPRFANNSRDVEIIDLLQRCWLHVVDEHELSRERGYDAN